MYDLTIRNDNKLTPQLKLEKRLSYFIHSKYIIMSKKPFNKFFFQILYMFEGAWSF